MEIKKWFDYDPFDWRIKVSAGVIIILQNKKILLCHPTGHKWINSFSFPKGGVEKDESNLNAAIRELREETSISISKEKVSNPTNPIIVEYKNKKGQKYKRVFLFTAFIDDISEIGLVSEILPKENLQLEEVDWCGFLSKEDAKSKIFHRVSHLLELID